MQSILSADVTEVKVHSISPQLQQASARSDNSGASSSVSTTSSVEFFGPIGSGRDNAVSLGSIALVGSGNASGAPAGTRSVPPTSSGSGGVAKKRRRRPTPPSEPES